MRLNFQGHCHVQVCDSGLCWSIFNQNFLRFMAFRTDPREGFNALDFDFDIQSTELAFMGRNYNADTPDRAKLKPGVTLRLDKCVGHVIYNAGARTKAPRTLPSSTGRPLQRRMVVAPDALGYVDKLDLSSEALGVKRMTACATRL